MFLKINSFYDQMGSIQSSQKEANDIFLESSRRVGLESRSGASESMSLKSYGAGKLNGDIPSIMISELHFLFLRFLKNEQRATSGAKNVM